MGKYTSPMDPMGIRSALTQLSNEKYSGYLLYIGDYTTQLYWDYFINHYKDPY